MNEQNTIGAQHFMYKNIGWLAIALMIIAAIAGISLIKNWKYIGAGLESKNTISVTADGEVRADKDTATFSFTHTADGKTAKEARAQLTEKVNPTLTAIYALGIDKKDVMTDSVSSYPKYEQVQCTPVFCPPQPQNPKIIGWQVSQSVSIKVRDIGENGDKASKVLETITDKGITNVYGPNFDIDEDRQNEFRVDARALAIKKAQEKADVLAKQLDVTLVRIVSFSEGNDNMYMPQYNIKSVMGSEMGGGGDAVSLPAGEGKIRSQVTIVYEIR